jgi:tetratricopeptide (TPR) repeat protein
MASQQDIEQLQERLVAQRATLALATLLAQQATPGSADALPDIDDSIREARAAIRRIKGDLRDRGVAVEDLPDDEAAPLGPGDLEPVLRSALPAAPEAQQVTLARRLAALLAGTPTPEALREQLLADASLAPLLATLAGTQIQAGSSVIDFGAGGQVGDVAIRDVAGGNIVTLNVYYDTPRAAPAVQPPPDNLARRLRVFLCHASGDKPAVRQLYARLQADGFAPWLDEEDLVGGQDWRREIPKAVRTTDVVVVCLSRTAVTKAGYVQKEIGFALDIAEEQPEGALFIIPLRLEAYDVPERLSRWQWVDSFEPRGYERLVRALRIRANQLALGAPSPQPGTPPSKAPAPQSAPTVAALWRQALAAYLMKQWPEAETLLAQVAERDPSYRDVQARLSEARRQLALLELYQDLCALRDDDHWQAVLDGLAELEQRQPAYPGSQGLRAWAEARQYREQRYDTALAAADQGDWPAAIAELEALLAGAPDDAEAQALVAHARAELAEAEQERQRRAEVERRRRESQH